MQVKGNASLNGLFRDCPHYCMVRAFSQWLILLARRTARRTLLATSQSLSENKSTDLIIWALEVTLYLIICSSEERNDSAAEGRSYYMSALIRQDCSNFAKVCSVNISIRSPSTDASGVPASVYVCVFQVSECVLRPYVILMSWFMCVNHLQGC